MVRQNMTVAATVATFPVLSVGFAPPTPGAYTLYYIYARTRAIVSPMTEGVAMKFFFNANFLENKQNDSRDSHQP